MVFVNLIFLFATHAYPLLPLPNGNQLRLELALTSLDRAYGLMFRESLPKDMGMLFVFPECDGEGFWMKNCHFPLDIIFMNEEGTIFHLEKNVPPCKKEPCPIYNPPHPACYVLEINGGLSSEMGLKEGVTLPVKEVLRARGIP